MEEIERIVNNSMGVTSNEEELELPPGFRFHPTDEELITHYLFKKAVDNSFAARAISDVDMNKIEPWDLPWKAKMGEKEWYFFSLRDKKYPTGLRTNRATSCGYWKATGKDKEILKGEKKCLIGMKKTLVFYKGRAPKGLKTNWVSHEFRLQPNSTFHNSLKFPKNEWVLCRVFHKKEGEKKVHISLINQPNSHSLANQMISSSSSAVFSGGSTTSTSVLPESDNYVHCFSNSNSINLQKTQQKDIYYSYFNNPPPLMAVSNTDDLFQRDYQIQSDYQFSGSYPSYPIQDHGNLKPLLENCGQNIIMKQRFKTEERFTESQETGLSNNDLNTDISSDMKKKSLENHLVTSTSLFGPHERDCIWNY